MWSTVRRGFDALMVLIYLGVGVGLLLAEEQLSDIKPYFRITLGLIACLYGLFRAYRIFYLYKQEREEEYEEDNGQK